MSKDFLCSTSGDVLDLMYRPTPPNRALRSAVKGGDAKKPRNALEAIKEGFLTGLKSEDGNHPALIQALAENHCRT